MIIVTEGAANSAQIFAKNRLVVIYPTANSAQLTMLQDLAKPGLKLILADKALPATNYNLTFLANAFTASVISAQAQQVLTEYGFIPSGPLPD